MGRKRHTAEQIIGKLRTAEIELAKGLGTAEVVRKLGIAEQTYYRWRKEYGGLRLDQAKRLKEFEKENARLKKLVADQELDRTLSELSMSVSQRREVTVILADAADDLERLEEAMTLIGQRLRAAELERPFDARFVNSLVARQAELMAYRRGTESRTVAEIAALLSPEQHARFTDLRIPPKDGHRGHLDPRKQPPERPAPRSRSDAGLDEGRSMRPDVYRQRRSVGGRVPKRPRVPPSAAQLANAS